MRLTDFDYELPQDLIAQYPAPRRELSRLLVLERAESRISHRKFCDIVDLLNAGDLVVLNDTKVMQARLIGRRSSGGKVEVLLLGPEKESDRRYRALIKPLGRLKKDEEIFFDKGFSCRLVDPQKKIVSFEGEPPLSVMRNVGFLPLPPYIRRPVTPLDSLRYQTVFAQKEGAVAAPTAGLHFSRALLARLRKKGVGIAALTLHVNYATFAPVRALDIRDHHMHAESYEIPEETVALIRRAKKNKKRVVAVGTTVCKALEDSALELSQVKKAKGIIKESRLFIYPPYTFKTVDALITNFHLPRTSLLMLISAFARYEAVRQAYREAVREKYRFYSYGDAMLIL